VGHDIKAVVEAIKNSPFLKEKSEFETTSAFETRRASFADRPLFGGVTPKTQLAFVLSTDPSFAPGFKYDADSETMTVTATGSAEEFTVEKGETTLDALVVRIERRRDAYIGGNAFGANVKVDRTHADDWGVAFDQDNWVFESLGDFDFQRGFTHSIPMTSDAAQTLKPFARLLLVCHLKDPWLRHKVFGKSATVSDPSEIFADENYLEVVPDELWLFNSQTGEVVRKFSEASVSSDADEQLKLKLRQTPLLLQVTAPSQVYRVSIDDSAEGTGVIVGVKTFRAKQKIVVTLDYPGDLSHLMMALNGKPYTPNWTKESTYVGDHEFITSATVTISLPTGQ
jgi:hypothetical protein